MTTPLQAPRIIAIANQKGGVGKTTTAMNLAAALTLRGQQVLLVDLDPQGNASTGLGVGHARRRASLYDLLFMGKTVAEVCHATTIEGLKVIPAADDYSSADLDLAAHDRRSLLVHDTLRSEEMAAQGFDYVLIDCPPSLNVLTINAMVAARSILVPLQVEFFALEGLSQLMLTVQEVRDLTKINIRVEGILLTMVDRRNNLAQMVEADARHNLGKLVYRTVIPRNVRLSESPSYGLPVTHYDPASSGAQAYRALADEMLERHKALAVA
jgi:chromosome partitioning protein